MISLDLESLRCFTAAAELLSFRAAARRVALSPAAFSDRIRKLEDQLGVALFARSTRSVALTPAGMRLLPQARRCLEEARRCLDVVAEEGRRPPFELRLGTRFELGLSWIVPALDTLRQARPERTLQLVFGDSDDLLRKLRLGRVDAAVTSFRLTRGSLAYAALHPEHYDFVAAPGLLETAPLRGPADAVAHTILDATPDLPLFRYLLDALPDAEPWPFARQEELGAIAAIRARALEGAGVAVLPRYYVQGDLDAGRLARLMPEVTLRSDTFRLIWQAGDPREAEYRALAQELRAHPLR